MKDFDAALERVVAGMQSRRALTDHEKRVVAYHEAGHALCGELLPSVDRVHRISIVPRGRALGYTLNLPEEDRYLKTREELIDFMTMLLGGRAAEQLVFGSITTGASDDLKRVAEIAHSMVHEYAMGTGSSSLRAIDEGAAEATRRVRDEEVRELADEAYRAAQAILDTHRVQLDELAATLLANEVLERPDIDRIMGHVPRAAPSRIGELSIAAATAVNRLHPPGGAPDQADYPRGAMLSAVDHVGVAVDSIDAALGDLPGCARDAARPPRDRGRAGRRRGAARRRRRPHRAAPAARAGHRRGEVPGPPRPRPSPRRLPRGVGAGDARGAQRRRRAPDRRATRAPGSAAPG